MRPWVKTENYWDVKFELTQQIKEALKPEFVNRKDESDIALADSAGRLKGFAVEIRAKVN